MTSDPFDSNPLRREDDANARLEALCAKFERDEARLRQQALRSLHELRNWVIVARVAFFLLLGGTFVGWLTYKQHIDSVVAKQVMKGQGFTNAISLAVAGDLHIALSELNEVTANLPRTQTPETRDFKRYVLLNTLWVLSNIEDLSSERQWVGLNEWRRLTKDQDFNAWFDLDAGVKSDPWLALQRGWCLLKYETQPTDAARDGNKVAVAGAKALFEKALRTLPFDRPKAGPHFGRGMIALLENDSARAVQHLECAALRDPASFEIAELRDRETPRETSIFWSELALRLHGAKYDFSSAWNRARAQLRDPSVSGLKGADCGVLENQGIVALSGE